MRFFMTKNARRKRKIGSFGQKPFVLLVKRQRQSHKRRGIILSKARFHLWPVLNARRSRHWWSMVLRKLSDFGPWRNGFQYVLSQLLWEKVQCNLKQAQVHTINLSLQNSINSTLPFFGFHLRKDFSTRVGNHKSWKKHHWNLLCKSGIKNE